MSGAVTQRMCQEANMKTEFQFNEDGPSLVPDAQSDFRGPKASLGTG
jgi:hypothetical protein